jgi:hypothetical protein
MQITTIVEKESLISGSLNLTQCLPPFAGDSIPLYQAKDAEILPYEMHLTLPGSQIIAHLKLITLDSLDRHSMRVDM